MTTQTLAEAASAVDSQHGRYRILETLAMSPTATIFKALDRELDETIVLKVLAPSVAANEQIVSQLKEEIRIARRIRHPNVARAYDLERWEDRLCISMEYIPGETLAQRLDAGPMPWAEVVPIVRTVALALQSAHEIGVVHRDLKPANLILDHAGRPYLLDFGIALGPRSAEAGMSEIVRGSPGYMAPERWKGVPGLPASDIYSLGVVAYEMVSGRPPFLSSSLRVLMSQHIHSPPPSLAERVADLPVDLEALIRSLLNKRPEQRPELSAVVRALRRLLPRSARPTSTTMRGRVLVVDDDATVRNLLAELLRRRGVEVVTACDGERGLECAQREAPDLIVLDVGMPGRDGVSVLEALKTDPATRSRPVVMLSGSSDPLHPALTRGLGAAAFLNKPVNGDVLDLILDKYLS